jgi:hypothetical protein
VISKETPLPQPFVLSEAISQLRSVLARNKAFDPQGHEESLWLKYLDLLRGQARSGPLMSSALKQFGVRYPIQLRWGHRINTKEKLIQSLSDPQIHLIEIDVYGHLVRHDRRQKAELTVEEALELVWSAGGKGVKLDLKDRLASEVVAKLVGSQRRYDPAQIPLVIINADVVPGPGRSRVWSLEEVAGWGQRYPGTLLSLGWRVGLRGYYSRALERMRQLAGEIGHDQEITFPVRVDHFFTGNLIAWLEQGLLHNPNWNITVYWTHQPRRGYLRRIMEFGRPEQLLCDY